MRKTYIGSAIMMAGLAACQLPVHAQLQVVRPVYATSEATSEATVDPTHEALEQAKKYFSLAEYKKAIDICNDILRKEPENLLALKRLGAIFYLLDMDRAALKTWEKAAKLEPENQNIRRYIVELKQRLQEGR